MKGAKIVLIILFVSLLLTCSYTASDAIQDENNDLWLILHLRDYKTDLPVSNISVTLTIFTTQKEMRFGPVLTNETGIIQLFFGDALKAFYNAKYPILKLDISNNYTLIKLNETFLEDLQYTAEYSQNHTRYTITGIARFRDIFKISPSLLASLENKTFIKMNLWVLKGKLVKISDSDPMTGMKDIISLKPAVKAIIDDEKSTDYERSYFFPLGYNVTILHKPKSKTEFTYPPLKVTVNENTTLINWMYHAAKAYIDYEMLEIDDEIGFFNSSGFSLDREIEEYTAIKTLLNRVLDLYQKREYGPAFGGSRIAKNKMADLKKWLSNLKNYALVTSIGIYIFVYIFASLIPALIFEEPAQNKIRLFGKVLIFSILILIFSLTHPALKMTYAIVIFKLIGSPTFYVDLPITLSGCFMLGSLTYFLITLLSIKKAPITDLALQLGVRNLKRRVFRSVLTLVTITIIVFSSIIFVNVSMSRSVRVKNAYPGTEREGVLIEPDINVAPLSEYDVNWIREQEWCKDLGYMERIRLYEEKGDSTLVCSGVLQVAEQKNPAEIVAIDPAFMDKYYNFSKYVRGLWQEFLEGKNVTIIPTSYNIQINDYVTLGIDEMLISETGESSLGVRPLGDFRVIGKFDPLALSKLVKIDGTPLFEDASNLVFVPNGTVKDPSIVISEVMIVPSEGFDPVEVAEEVAYMLGVPAIANKNGLARWIEWSLELSTSGLIPFLIPLAISSLMVYNIMASVYEERKREFTMLATLGLDPKNAFKVFIIEAFLLGLIGTLFGFLGSYIFVMISSPWQALSNLSFSSANWSISTILIALFTGIIMTFLGSYIPAVRTQGLSLMGRVKKRRFLGELVTEGDTTTFTLPIRETVQNSEILYTYIRETLGKIKASRVDTRTIKGEIFGDGSFIVSFVALGSKGSVFIPCEIRGIREKEILVPVVHFPSKYRVYGEIRDILRDLEEHMIGFSAWKDLQIKMKIVREAPKKRKTPEEILDEIREIIAQIKDCDKKLRTLETQKDKISEEVYDEFRQKYIDRINDFSKRLRSMVIGLESHSRQLLQEIKKVEIEVQRITTAYNLGEISEEEYVKTCGPLQGRLANLKRKIKEIEEIYEFLKAPSKFI